jgi:hypothetical protein
VELLAAYGVIAVVLTAPFALWVYVRRARWRDPGKAVAFACLAALALVFAVSAVSSWFYPFGFPGQGERAWRATALECQARYAAARTASDSAAVDMFQPPASGNELLPICHSLKVAGLLAPGRECSAGSRCARIRRALRLPDP